MDGRARDALVLGLLSLLLSVVVLIAPWSHLHTH
jgi:hypothetical protein